MNGVSRTASDFEDTSFSSKLNTYPKSENDNIVLSIRLYVAAFFQLFQQEKQTTKRRQLGSLLVSWSSSGLSFVNSAVQRKLTQATRVVAQAAVIDINVFGDDSVEVVLVGDGLHQGAVRRSFRLECARDSTLI